LSHAFTAVEAPPAYGDCAAVFRVPGPACPARFLPYIRASVASLPAPLRYAT
jgi:hypothetical protein